MKGYTPLPIRHMHRQRGVHMSWLSSGLAAIGISREAQRTALGNIPVVGSALQADAQARAARAAAADLQRLAAQVATPPAPTSAPAPLYPVGSFLTSPLGIGLALTAGYLLLRDKK